MLYSWNFDFDPFMQKDESLRITGHVSNIPDSTIIMLAKKTNNLGTVIFCFLTKP